MRIILHHILGIALLFLSSCVKTRAPDEETTREAAEEQIPSVDALLKEYRGATNGINDVFFHLPRGTQKNKHELDKLVKALITHGADINVVTDDCDSPINHATEEGDTIMVEVFLDNGAYIDRGSWGMQSTTSLQIAAALGYTDLVRLLLKRGALVEGWHYWGVTPLSSAASCGNWMNYTNCKRAPREEYVKIVKLLLEHGARVNTDEKYGTTPLTWAVNANCEEIVKILIDHEAKIYWKTKRYDEDCPLITAKKKGFTNIYSFLTTALEKSKRHVHSFMRRTPEGKVRCEVTPGAYWSEPVESKK